MIGILLSGFTTNNAKEPYFCSPNVVNVHLMLNYAHHEDQDFINEMINKTENNLCFVKVDKPAKRNVESTAGNPVWTILLILAIISVAILIAFAYYRPQSSENVKKAIKAKIVKLPKQILAKSRVVTTSSKG